MASESGLWDPEDFFKLKLRELKADVQCQEINHDSNTQCNAECRRVSRERMKIHIRSLWSFLQEETQACHISISFDSVQYKQVVTTKLNVPWCIVCGKKSMKDDTISCSKCCSSYHEACRVADTPADSGNQACNECKAGCTVKSGDVVWHKMKKSVWWPALVLSVGERPNCLSVKPTNIHLAIKFYGEQPGQYCWADPRHFCTFNPNHYLSTATSGNKHLVNAFRLAAEAWNKKLPQSLSNLNIC